jgi:nitrate reductase NapA
MDMAGMDRRSFLQGALATSAAMALAPVTDFSEQQRGVRWHKAPCQLCGVGCGLLVGIQDGRAVAAKGDPESPVNRGLACAKGYYAIQALYGRDRLTQAMLRRDEGMSLLPMAQALDVVAARLSDTLASHGPQAVALYGSERWTVGDAVIAARLFRGVLGSPNVDTSARLLDASAEVGLAGTYGLHSTPASLEDLDQADVFVLWDLNMAETDPVLFSRLLERRRTSPATRIIDLATRTTRTSYAADLSLLFAPRTDLWIANAICRDLVERDLVDHEFLRRNVAFRRGAEGIGQGLATPGLLPDDGIEVDLDAWARFLTAYTPEEAQRRSGMAASDIRWLASLYADPARKVVTAWGANVNQQVRGTWLNNALHNIHLLVGKVSIPGNAAMSVTSQPGGGSLTATLLAHDGVPAEAGTRDRIARIWDAGPQSPSVEPARPALSIFRALERGDIRFLWIQSSDPMLSLPNLARFRAASRQAGAFLVVSDAYATPTTDVADVILPTTLWIERDGISASSGRRVQHWSKLVEPPGSSLSEGEQLISVARRLGHGARFPWPMEQSTDATWDLLQPVQGESGPGLPTVATLHEAPGALWPTASGRDAERLYHAAHDPAVDATHGEHDFYGHADHRAWIWLRPHDVAAESPDPAFPFWFSTGPVVEHWSTGTLTRRIPSLHRAVPRAYAELNPADARPLGIRDGDIVRLTSRRGSVELEARIDYRGQPPRGHVFAPAFDEGAAVNQLTLDAGCPLSGTPDYMCAVRVARVRSRP